MTIHQERTHPEYVEGCYVCRIGTVTAWGCTPTRSQGAGKADHDGQKKWDRELDLYADARRQGIQPAGTTTKKIREAVELSDKVGVAYDAGGLGRPDDAFTRTVVSEKLGA